MRVPNIKAISWDVFEHAEVLWPMLHLECNRLRRLQHLNVHLLCRLILHIHRVVLKDKRRWELKKTNKQVNFTSWKIRQTQGEEQRNLLDCLRSSVKSFAVPVKVPPVNTYISFKLSAVLKCRSIDLCHVWRKKTNRIGNWRTERCCAGPMTKPHGNSDSRPFVTES